jgi:alkylhydroperoxidase/carboxymuconolactone decarboxylase family protein YurZ
MPSPNWIQFAETDPKTAEGYRGLIRPALADGALDADMKELIYTVLVASQGYLPGLESHIDAMLGRGMKADVIREAVRLILPSCGIATYLALVPVLEAAIARHEKP